MIKKERGDFNSVPGLTDSTGNIGTRPNQIAPGKRMLSSMTPTIVSKDGRPWMLIGTPGGRTIINTILQCVLNAVDFRMNISEAITAGRIHHQWFPDVLRIERGATTLDSQRLLETMGHRVQPIGPLGRAMGIMIDPRSGIRYGAPDPRAADGMAAGY